MKISIENVGGQFPALERKVFLDAACVSLAPRRAVTAVSDFLQEVMLCPSRSATLHHLALDSSMEAARLEAARLIAALPDEVALVESTTHGLSIVARALPMESGDNILISDLEFIQVPLPWRQPGDGIRPEIRLVGHRNGELLPSDFEKRMDARTRAVVVSSVQWCNGFRIDLDGLAQLCRGRGVLLVVDAVQQLGAFPLDTRQTPVDIVSCGGHKWLNSPFGTGLLFIRRSLRDRLKSPLSGYLALDPPSGGWSAHFQNPSASPLTPISFTEGARLFENGGTGNYPGAVGLAASLHLINELGTAEIESRIRNLTDHLIRGLKDLSVSMVTPLDPQCRSGIVTFGLEERARELALQEYLLDRNILISLRYTSNVGGLRVSCHFFNDTRHIDLLLNAVEDFLQTGEPRRALVGSPDAPSGRSRSK
ncbi:MAG: aminotransferase class V-fold PLP-dependent enzyme [Acidobacteriota bacterium]